MFRLLQMLGVLFCITCFGVFQGVFAQTEQSVDNIRKIYQDVNKKVAECEENGATSNTFLMEIVVNKNNGSYPAVGIYKSIVKFYYTFGDREKSPYPNRLLKIMIATNRSAMTETMEFLFDERGYLLFYFEKTETEKRVYFDSGKPIKILDGKKTIEPGGKAAAELGRQINKEQQSLLAIFQNTLAS